MRGLVHTADRLRLHRRQMLEHRGRALLRGMPQCRLPLVRAQSSCGRTRTFLRRKLRRCRLLVLRAVL